MPDETDHRKPPQNPRGQPPTPTHWERASAEAEGDGTKAFGFSEHVIVGQIGHLYSTLVDGSTVVNCRVSVNPPQRKRNAEATLYEVSVWDAQARAFDKLGMQPGDRILFRLENVRVDAWLDGGGHPQASIKGAADKFVDLRPQTFAHRKAPREREGQGEPPGRPGPKP